MSVMLVMFLALHNNICNKRFENVSETYASGLSDTNLKSAVISIVSLLKHKKNVSIITEFNLERTIEEFIKRGLQINEENNITYRANDSRTLPIRNITKIINLTVTTGMTRSNIAASVMCSKYAVYKYQKIFGLL